jgi:hypothetical protein
MRGREQANAWVIVPTAPNEVKAAMSETGCSRNKPSINGEPLRAEQGCETEKARNETK